VALTEDDLKALGSFIKQETSQLLEEFKADYAKDAAQTQADQAVASRDATVGKPEVDPEAGPKFYVHLADGSIVQSFDSQSTHMANEAGEPVAVIGRYQMGA
jgi:hypothetical protein